ncbi:MAG: YfiR family protein [Candidatus Acidiferrales bacterium]
MICTGFGLFCGPRSCGQEPGPTEYQLKAAFLFNFAKFVEWPASSFASPQGPFSICILGTDPFGPGIDETLQGQMIGGRAVTVLRVREAAQLRRCQVAFISASEKGNLPRILQTLRGANVLLVGETPGFVAAGGTIEFEMQDNRVRFSINPDAAERAGLRVSSKLLSLATIVHDADENGKG